MFNSPTFCFDSTFDSISHMSVPVNKSHKNLTLSIKQLSGTLFYFVLNSVLCYISRINSKNWREFHWIIKIYKNIKKIVYYNRDSINTRKRAQKREKRVYFMHKKFDA